MPDGTEVRVTPDLKQQVLVVTATDQPGNYRVQAGGTAEGVDRGFSVNLAAEQTRLERIPQSELAQLFGPIPYRIARTREEIELDVGSSGGIWRPFPGVDSRRGRGPGAGARGGEPVLQRMMSDE